MVVKLTVTKAGDEDGPAATLRVEFVIGDGAFSLGTDAPCRVLFPPSQGVERCHCSLSLRSPSSATRGAEHSEWELTPRDGIVRVPTLASTDDGGFCQVFALHRVPSLPWCTWEARLSTAISMYSRQVMEAVREHSAPGWQPLQFVDPVLTRTPFGRLRTIRTSYAYQ